MTSKIDLRVSCAGLDLKNPVMSASGTFGYGMEFSPYGHLSELGAVIVKGLSLEPRAGNASPRIAETESGMINAIGLQNDGVETFIKEKLPLLVLENVPAIANIYANNDEDFGELANILSAEKHVAALEVNISCPNVKEGGILFGQDPKLAEQVVRAVKKNARKTPVIVKLSPNVTDITSIAKAVEYAGADIVSCINTLSAMSVDLERRAPSLANIIGGLSGAAIKPVALRCVWQVVQAISIPVIGIGGICNARDVLEFLLVGASAVQVGTANFSDPSRIFQIVKDLNHLCEELHITDISEFIGSLKIA